MMIDSHCHLNDEAFLGDCEEAIIRSKNAGVGMLLVVGWDVESSKRAVEIANGHEGVYAAIGIHPENLDGVDDSALDELRALSKNDKVVAIGEIGLDYHWFKEESHRAKQRLWFAKQIELANELGLPVSIHAREASEETYDLLKKNPIENGAVLHCYSGSAEMLNRFVGFGLYFGFDGPITYKNAEGPRSCVLACPTDRILSETDSPYLSPLPYRGKRNEPSNTKEIVSKMAEVKGISMEKMESSIEENFRRLFGING